MIRIAIIGLVTMLLAIQFKGKNSEYSLYISIAGCILIFYMGLRTLDEIIGTIRTIQSYINVNSAYITILVKMVGIAYIAEFSSNLCKDAGYSAIGSQIELVGKLSILAISMPILQALLDTINEFLK